VKKNILRLYKESTVSLWREGLEDLSPKETRKGKINEPLKGLVFS